ncbi:hypothetical protein GCM10008967_37940 [Bacillus carboniphilus]|uniref:Uncharacterized protein n=1 Tax=Bacillus carboniphilus TaxID=86663 RepID=A0ABN0WQ53_9BACI
MSRKKVSKTISFTLVILLIFLGINSYQHYQNEKQQWENFIRHFYSTIDRAHNRIDLLIEKRPTDEALSQVIRELEIEFIKANEIVISGNSYVDDDIYNTFFFRRVPSLLNGLKMTGTLTAEIQPLAEDNQLDEAEVAILQVIKDCLTKAKQAIYSEGENGPNLDLTVAELNDVLKTYLLKDIPEIYNESRS